MDRGRSIGYLDALAYKEESVVFFIILVLVIKVGRSACEGRAVQIGYYLGK